MTLFDPTAHIWKTPAEGPCWHCGAETDAHRYSAVLGDLAAGVVACCAGCADAFQEDQAAVIPSDGEPPKLTTSPPGAWESYLWIGRISPDTPGCHIVPVGRDGPYGRVAIVYKDQDAQMAGVLVATVDAQVGPLSREIVVAPSHRGQGISLRLQRECTHRFGRDDRRLVHTPERWAKICARGANL